MADQTLPIQDIRNHLGHDLTMCAAHIVHRADQIATAVSLMGDAVAPLGKGSDDSEVQHAAEAVAGSVLRIVHLALECTHEAGRMLAASSAREQIEQLDASRGE